MKDQIVELAKNLIAIRSDSENETERNMALDLVVSHLKDYTVEKFERNGFRSVLVYKAAKRPEKFKIILSGHVDVVPGNEDKYNPVIEGNKMYGIGSLDMKSNVSALIHTFKDVVDKVDYDIAIQLVTDEELGGFDGAMYQVEQGVRADFVIAGETTNFDIVNEAKGILWLKIKSKGVSAHGAYPWNGDNAIWKMNEFLNKLKEKYPVPTEKVWRTTVNLAKLETSNKALNRIPDDCTASIDVRFIPADSKTILDEIKSLIPKDFELEILANEPAMFVAEDNKYLQLLKKIDEEVTGREVKLYTAQGSSDARHFTRVGNDGIEFGPIGGNIGSDDEYIDIDSLGKYHELLTKFLLELNNK